MPAVRLLQRIARRDSDKTRIACEVASSPKDIQTVLDGLNAPDARTRFGCSKVLRLASEQKPDALYPWMDFFIRQLDNENTFLRMDAARAVASLTAVDSRGTFEGILEKYFSPISGPALIPAANVIGSAVRIVQAKPRLSGRVVAEILKVEDAEYATEECRNVAFGHAIRSLDAVFDRIDDRAPVIEFVRRQLGNTRPATRKKAAAFLRKHGKLVKT